MKGKHAVISGGTGGLGTAVVAALVERGAVVHIPCFEAEVPDGFALREHERVECATGVDLRDADQVRGFYEGLPQLWASIHLAGGFAMAPVEAIEAADFRGMFELNAVSCFLCCREAVAAMRRTGAGGRIVNVAARPVLEPTGGMLAYSASKAAVAAITRALDAEVSSEGIRVNAIVPSIIDTPANRRAMPDADHDSWPKPAEIAATIAFLASSDNALTGGALVPVYGRA